MSNAPLNPSQRYSMLSKRAGLVCIASMIVFFIGLASIRIFMLGSPKWFGVVTGLGFLGSLISIVVCIAAALFGAVRKRRSTLGCESAEPIDSGNGRLRDRP